MKKILTTLLLFAALNSYSQSAKDTSAPKLLYLIMPEKNWGELLQLIKSADEKPSKVKDWEQLLLTSLRLYEVPKKDKSNAKP